MKGNRTLAAWAPDLIPPRQRIGTESLRLRSDLIVADIRSGLAAQRARDRCRRSTRAHSKA
jgi:ATP-dependent Lhr-like helicase